MALETMALECIPATKRRGAFALDRMSARQLAELVEKYGHEVVKDALTTCGGADRPVAMCASRLSRPVAAPKGSRHAEPHEAPWEKRQRESGHSKPWVAEDKPFKSMADYIEEHGLEDK